MFALTSEDRTKARNEQRMILLIVQGMQRVQKGEEKG